MKGERAGGMFVVVKFWFGDFFCIEVGRWSVVNPSSPQASRKSMDPAYRVNKDLEKIEWQLQSIWLFN